MKSRKGLLILLTLFISLGLVNINNAQSDKQSKEAEKQLKLKQRVDKTINTQVTKEYDKFKDSTSISLSIMPVYIPRLYTDKAFFTVMSKQPHFYVTAFYLSVATETKLKSFVLSFVTKQLQGFWFQEKRDLTFLADGKRIFLGRTTHDGVTEALFVFGGTRQITNEAMSIAISADDFIRLANAKEVEFQLGTVEGKLSEKHLEAFRNLIANVPISSTP